MQRIKNVLNVHFVDRKGTFLVPLYILAALVAIVVAIGVIARVAGANEAEMYEGMKWNGAVWALLGMGFGIGAMTMTQYLAFALGLGITRREWLAGSSVMFVLVAAGTAVVVTLLKLIEQATTGFGLSVRLFDTVHTGPASWWQTLLQVFLMVMAAMTITAAISGIWTRWGKTGLMWLAAAGIALGVVLFGIGILLPAEQVMAVFTWFGGLAWISWMGMLAAVMLIGAAAFWLLGIKAEVR